MSDFKFACPGCSQRISANDDYVGHQITCPSCQAVIVVPSNPNAAAAAVPSIAIAGPPGMPPPPTPPKAARLSVSALSAPEAHAPAAAAAPNPAAEAEPGQQGSAGYRAHLLKKPKKDHTGLITIVAVIIILGLPTFLYRDWIAAKWKAWRGPSAAEIAAAKLPPPPPPELSAAEVMQKVVEVYKTIPSFSSTGKTTAVLDMSAISPAMAAAGPVTTSADLTLKMAKPARFRIDLALAMGATNFTVTGWSTGNGDFVQANNIRTKAASEDQLFNRFNSGVNVGVGEIVRLFIDDPHQALAQADIEWTRNKDENLAGQPCYVLAGNVKHQNVLIWVMRESFLIAQTQVEMDGKSGLGAMDDAKIKEELTAANNGKEPSLLEIANVKKMSKMTGTITESYGNIQTNVALAVTDFQPAAPGAAMRGAGAPAQPQPPGGRATQIVRGRRGG